MKKLLLRLEDRNVFEEVTYAERGIVSEMLPQWYHKIVSEPVGFTLGMGEFIG